MNPITRVFACTRRMALVACALAPLVTATARGQEVIDSAAAASRQRLEHRRGAWSIRMELLGPDGAVRRTITGTDTATTFGGGDVLHIVTRFPELGDLSQSWMFRDPADGQFKNVSVDTKGNFWVLTGPLDRFVLTSDDHPTPNGPVRLRFTHSGMSADGFTALGEYSLDGGMTWTVMSRQRFRRQ